MIGVQLLWAGAELPVDEHMRPIAVSDIELAHDYGEPLRWRDAERYIDRDAYFAARLYNYMDSKHANIDVRGNCFLASVMVQLELALRMRQNNIDKRNAEKIKNGNR